MALHRWHLKCAAQQVLSLLPWGWAINARLGRRRLDRLDEFTLQQGLEQLALLRQLGISLTNAVALELGSGKMPILPLLYRLNGVRRCHLTDLRPLLSLRATQVAVRELLALARAGSIPSTDPECIQAEGYSNHSHLYARTRLRYDPNFNLRRPRIRKGRVDLVFSRTVLEHIPEPALPAVHEGLFRLLRPGATAIHTIDCSDHFEHFDKSIPRLNFLRYSRPAWRLINNGILYQNRLRASDHVRLLREAGFEILRVEGQPNPRAMEELAHIPIHQDFAGHTPEDLATITVHIVARKPAKESGFQKNSRNRW